MENEIKRLLAAVVHPETGKDIVSDGFIEHIASTANKITIVLRFAKTRDPFAGKIRKQVETILQLALYQHLHRRSVVQCDNEVGYRPYRELCKPTF